MTKIKSVKDAISWASGMVKPKDSLPVWSNSSRGVPNIILRSALFAAIQGKDRRFIKDEMIAAYSGIEIKFRGEQLDQMDLDVFEHCMHLAKEQKAGKRCYFTAHAFLKAIGRSTGGEQHEWLKTTFLRLTGAVLDVRTPSGKVYFGSLIEGGCRDETTGEYEIWINSKLLKLYEAGWTKTDWIQRTKLSRKPLAMWLHGFYSTHSKPVPIRPETIHKLCGSKNSNLSRFKTHLQKALSDLVECGALKKWEIKDELIYVDKSPKARRLSKKLTSSE